MEGKALCPQVPSSSLLMLIRNGRVSTPTWKNACDWQQGPNISSHFSSGASILAYPSALAQLINPRLYEYLSAQAGQKKNALASSQWTFQGILYSLTECGLESAA
ncbi:hypothetical protein NFI96_011062 [Prochilodus magdalenae]|nr:hypothetical protein NFI96_011062 [Prochilodus magdalenae]